MKKLFASNSTKANFISMILGNFFYYGIQYIILILFTKNFSQTIVGYYIFSLAFVKPIFIPLNLQLRSLFVTETKSNLTISNYHSLRILGNILTIIAVIVIGYVTGVESMSILIIITIIRLIESQIEMCHAVYQKKQNMVYIGFSRMVSGLLIIFTISVGIYLKLPFVTVMIMWAIALTSVLVFMDIPKAIKKDPEFLDLKRYFNWPNMKVIFLFAWPLFFLEVVSKYYESFPNLSVEKYFGLDTLAVFGSIIYFKAIGSQILTQIINIVEPKLANLWKNNDYKKFQKSISKLVGLGFVIGVVMIMLLAQFGKPILRIIFTDEYASYSMLLTLVAISSCISYLYSFLSTALTCMRRHQIKVPMRVIGLVVLVSLTYLNSSELTLYSFIYYLIYTETLICALHFIAYFYFLKKAQLTRN